MPWYWTDEMARLLMADGVADNQRLQGWITHPVAVKREGDANRVALDLLSEDEEEPAKAA